MGIRDKLPLRRRKKVGLALGSGAARGLAHIGVLEVLQKEGIPIDMIAGTSAGALFGALYAWHRDISRIKDIVEGMGIREMAHLIDLSLPKSGFIKGNKVKKLLETVIGGDLQFSDLQIPFKCVATDIVTGDEVVFSEGSVLEAVRASISIPAVFTAVNKEGHYLVDGALVNPVPVETVREMGADFVIAVNVTPDITAHSNKLKKEQAGPQKEPGIVNVIMQSIYIGTNAMVRHSLEHADIAIEPETIHSSPADFHHGHELIRQGEIATRNAIPAIKSKLKP